MLTETEHREQTMVKEKRGENLINSNLKIEIKHNSPLEEKLTSSQERKEWKGESLGGVTQLENAVSKRKSGKRKVGDRYTRMQKKIMHEWIKGHNEWPYPRQSEKKQLALLAGITTYKVSIFFNNYRSREWNLKGGRVRDREDENNNEKKRVCRGRIESPHPDRQQTVNDGNIWHLNYPPIFYPSSTPTLYQSPSTSPFQYFIPQQTLNIPITNQGSLWHFMQLQKVRMNQREETFQNNPNSLFNHGNSRTKFFTRESIKPHLIKYLQGDEYLENMNYEPIIAEIIEISPKMMISDGFHKIEGTLIDPINLPNLQTLSYILLLEWHLEPRIKKRDCSIQEEHKDPMKAAIYDLNTFRIIIENYKLQENINIPHTESINIGEYYRDEDIIGAYKVYISKGRRERIPIYIKEMPQHSLFYSPPNLLEGYPNKHNLEELGDGRDGTLFEGRETTTTTTATYRGFTPGGKGDLTILEALFHRELNTYGVGHNTNNSDIGILDAKQSIQSLIEDLGIDMRDIVPTTPENIRFEGTTPKLEDLLEFIDLNEEEEREMNMKDTEPDHPPLINNNIPSPYSSSSSKMEESQLCTTQKKEDFQLSSHPIPYSEELGEEEEFSSKGKLSMTISKSFEIQMNIQLYAQFKEMFPLKEYVLDTNLGQSNTQRISKKDLIQLIKNE